MANEVSEKGLKSMHLSLKTKDNDIRNKPKNDSSKEHQWAKFNKG